MSARMFDTALVTSMMEEAIAFCAEKTGVAGACAGAKAEVTALSATDLDVDANGDLRWHDRNGRGGGKRWDRCALDYHWSGCVFSLCLSLWQRNRSRGRDGGPFDFAQDRPFDFAQDRRGGRSGPKQGQEGQSHNADNQHHRQNPHGQQPRAGEAVFFKVPFLFFPVPEILVVVIVGQSSTSPSPVHQLQQLIQGQGVHHVPGRGPATPGCSHTVAHDGQTLHVVGVTVDSQLDPHFDSTADVHVVQVEAGRGSG